MSLLQFSEYNSNENVENNYNNNTNNNINSKRRNRTLKRRENMNNVNATSKVEQMKNMINREGFTDSDSSQNDDDDDDLANFEPISPPTSGKIVHMDIKEQDKNQHAQQAPQKTQQQSTVNGDEGMDVEGFNGMREGYSEQYMNQFVPYYQNAANASNSNNNSELTEKLNYLIHLVEEQKDEKTGHVTEELILYSFLGVFVIYIVDSFSRVGKYVR